MLSVRIGRTKSHGVYLLASRLGAIGKLSFSWWAVGLIPIYCWIAVVGLFMSSIMGRVFIFRAV